MKALKNSNGFTVIHTLLVIVILVIVGFTCWYVWNANDETNKNIDNSQSDAAPKSVDKKSPQQDKYTSLDSLGVTFEKPAAFNDLLLTDSVNEAGDKFIAFSAQKLIDLEANTYCDTLGDAPIPFHIGMLFMVEGTYPSEDRDDNTYGTLVKQFDGYNLQFREPSDNCFESKENEAQADVMSKQLYEALKASVREE